MAGFDEALERRTHEQHLQLLRERASEPLVGWPLRVALLALALVVLAAPAYAFVAGSPATVQDGSGGVTSGFPVPPSGRALLGPIVTATGPGGELLVTPEPATAASGSLPAAAAATGSPALRSAVLPPPTPTSTTSTTSTSSTTAPPPPSPPSSTTTTPGLLNDVGGAVGELGDALGSLLGGSSSTSATG